MARQGLNPTNSVFVILSFEGPDSYSYAGGLGTRVTQLGQALADLGFLTHLVFIGDPAKPGHEATADGHLILHRWCQWISNYHPMGVYDGLEGKIFDYTNSVPGFVIDQIVWPAIGEGKIPVIIGEEWHTAEALCRISDTLYYRGARHKALFLWNANNTFGFESIDWKRLSTATTITTVSKYMKHTLWDLGINPIVIPNGIPNTFLKPVERDGVVRLRELFKDRVVLTKVARWDPDKRWNAAVASVALLKKMGARPVLIARGGLEAHGQEVIRNAKSLGLSVADIETKGDTVQGHLDAVRQGNGADVLNLRFFLPQESLRTIYAASDAVLANSGHEPFGLVGLEVMAVGGIAFTGSTGEDYAISYKNAIVLETADPTEIARNVLYLRENPEVTDSIRKDALRTARSFTWPEIVQKNLIVKLELMGREQGLLV